MEEGHHRASQGAAPNVRFLIDDLMLLRAFVAVVETRSFTGAGKRLNVVPSTISKHIASLERRLDGRLITRTTKHLSVTELGARFYERCLLIFHEVEEAELEIGEYQAEPQGNLRISAATTLAVRHFGPIFVSFLQRYPKVTLEVSLSATNKDLVADGYDVGIRISSELDPNLIALKLAPNTRVYCASPLYLQKNGYPEAPRDLLNHNCLVMRGVLQSSRWPFIMPDGAVESVVVSGNYVADNGDLLRQALLTGIGVGYLARFIVQEHLDSGELVEIFPESRVTTSNIYVVYPDRKKLPLKTRAFIDHLRDEFRLPPAWATSDRIS